jgi:hypothetical protein
MPPQRQNLRSWLVEGIETLRTRSHSPSRNPPPNIRLHAKNRSIEAISPTQLRAPESLKLPIDGLQVVASRPRSGPISGRVITLGSLGTGILLCLAAEGLDPTHQLLRRGLLGTSLTFAVVSILGFRQAFVHRRRLWGSNSRALYLPEADRF